VGDVERVIGDCAVYEKGLRRSERMPLERAATAAFGLVLLTFAHTVGWPFPRGGARAISDALASYLRSLGGVIVRETAKAGAHPPLQADRPSMSFDLGVWKLGERHQEGTASTFVWLYLFLECLEERDDAPAR